MSSPFVTIVSADRDLLRDLSWTLSLFGYQVTATLDDSEECPVRRPVQPGILLLDTRSESETNKLLNSGQTSDYTYRVAIDEPDRTEQLLLAGADDVLRLPINKGELLTRLRAGVRRVEFERRIAARNRRDQDTGLLTQEALCHAMNSNSRLADDSSCCVAFGIDYLKQIREQYGTHATRHLKATLARCVQRQLAEGELAGLADDNATIAVLNRSPAQAHAFIEAVNNSFAASDTLVREIRVVSTLTAVVADWPVEVDVEQQLEHCASTLEQAHYFGGDYTASAEEVQQLVNTWRTNLDAGVPFQNVVAQDLMELFPAIITNEQAATYAAMLPVSGLQVPCLPVVDESGTLCGSLDFASPRATAAGLPNTIEYDQPLNDLFEVFNTTESDYLIVVDGQQCPLGYLTCEGLASLVLDKISTDRYESPDTSSSQIESLVVPVVPTEVAESAQYTAS